MKILHTVESYLPARHGMQEVVTQLSERLVRKGHEVTIATSFNEDRKTDVINGVKIRSFKIKGNYATGIIGESDKYQQFLSEGDFDIVTNFAAQQWATDLMLPILKDLKCKKVFVPTGFSGLFNKNFDEYFEKMQYWIKDFDSSVFLSDDYRDINFARQHSAKNIMLIPNGASKEEFEYETNVDIRRKYNIDMEHLLVLTVGSHTGLKGHDDSMEIFKRSGLEKAVLVIVGNSPIFTFKSFLVAVAKTILSMVIPSIKPNCFLNCKIKSLWFNYSFKSFKRKSKIYSLELNRASIVSCYKAANIFLFPSNIECSPIVLFECCAAGLPFLTSDVGNSEEIVSWTGAGEILPTYKNKNEESYVNIDQSAKKLNQLSSDRSLRDKYSKAGISAHKDRFNWEAISNDYEELYMSLL